jgi:1-aminocyclopropane-1-carboxylate deaminase/D-cysteine desulfhydrase-like pyridoxal-dependent ACC family enzyme
LPDEAVEVLNKRWDDVWEGVQRHLFDDSGIEFDADETPIRAYTQPGLPEADVTEADGEWDDWNAVVESDSAQKKDTREADAVDSESVVDYRFDHELLANLTPIECGWLANGASIWLKRDDLYELGGAQGGKVRACLELSKGAKGLVTAGARQSPQMQIVSRVAHYLGIPCRCHIPEAPTQEPTPEMVDAKKHGAELVHVYRGYNNVIISSAKHDEKLKEGWTYIPFGMESNDAMNCTRGQVRDIPPDVKRIVIPLGSGMSAAGLLWGLQDAGLDIPVLGVRVGCDQTKRLDKFAPKGWREQMTIEDVSGKYPYKKRVKASIGDIALDPIYEAKAAEYLQDGDLFWIIGVRAGVK